MTAPFQTALGMAPPLERGARRGYAGAVALTMGERRSAVVALVLMLASACALRAEPPSDAATSHHDFADVPYWSMVFDDPGRDAWQKPAELVAALGLAHGG